MNDLIDRYVEAVVRTVPERNRADVAEELHASLDAEIAARVAGGEDPATAERDALIALGDPDELAAGYADRPLVLIGPRWYLAWRRTVLMLLRLVLPIAVVAVAFGLTVAQVASTSGAGATPAGIAGVVIGQTVGIGVTIAVHLVFWTTAAFAVLERTDAGARAPEWSLDRLADAAPSPRERASDFVAVIVWLALLAAFVVVDQAVGLVWLRGTSYPILNPDLWPWGIAPLLAIVGAQAVVSIVVWRRGMTGPLAVGASLLTAAGALWAITLLVQGRLLNPELWALATARGDVGAEVAPILTTMAVFGVVAVAALDIVQQLRRVAPHVPMRTGSGPHRVEA